MGECAAIVPRTKREGVRKKIKLSVSFMLEDWLIYHIRETDRELAGFLRDHSPGATIPHLPDVRTVRESRVIPAGLGSAGSVPPKRLRWSPRLRRWRSS
jgi:hypothetical protein